MMPYYDNKRNEYQITHLDGRTSTRLMTEAEAEEYQASHYWDDVQALSELPDPLPDEAADDYLDCTCDPDLPDGRVNGGRGTLCPACRKYFQELQEEDLL